MKTKKSDGMTFDEWIIEAEIYARNIDERLKDYVAGNRECWQDYWRDDYTPKDAVGEDLSYAE